MELTRLAVDAGQFINRAVQVNTVTGKIRATVIKVRIAALRQ